MLNKPMLRDWALETQQSERQWGIREFAEIFDVTPRTIRFYEDKGLLSPVRDGGARIFHMRDYVRFEKIMRAKRLGFTLDDIKAVFDVTDGHIKDRAELTRRKKSFRRVISSLQRRREDITTISQYMTEICDAIDSHLETTFDIDTDAAGIFTLASAYEAKFSQTPFIEETADDFHPHSRDTPVMAGS